MTSNAINFWPTSAVDPGGYVIATPTSIFVPITTGTDRMAPTAWHQTTPPPWDRGPRLTRIQAIRAVSFAHQIERDWDEIAREAVEGNHKRANVRREFRGK